MGLLIRHVLAEAGAVAVVVAWAAAATPALAQARPSLEGFTGQLATPSAWTAGEGTAHLLFTPADDTRFPGAESRRYALALGVLRWVEVGGRVTDVQGARVRDLSFGLKLRLPLDLLLPRAPVAFAVGSQDEGGAATNFRSRYAVASARLWRLGGSIGYGLGPDRMEGWFGGGTLALHDALELVGDWDGRDLAAGARASVPLAPLGLPLRLGAIARAVVNREPRTVEWGFTLEVPLWLNGRPDGGRSTPGAARGGGDAAPPAIASRGEAPAAPVVVPARGPGGAAPAPSAPGPPRAALRALEGALVEDGLEEVRAGLAGETLVVEYENNRYDHDEADAVAVVLREVDRAGLGDRPIAVVVKRSGLVVAELTFPPGGAGARAAAGVRFAPGQRRVAWASISPRNRRALHSTLVLAPGLRTFVATELGVLDYLVTFRPDLVVPLWPGATAFARAEVPLTWSDSLGDRGYFRDYRTPAHVEYATVHQAVRIAPGLWAMVGGGLFQWTDAGGLGELLWTGAGGTVALGLQGSRTWNERYEERHGLTGSVRLRVPRLDGLLLVRGGRFVNGDRGVAVELSRWFGDTQVGVFYTRSEVSIAGAFFTVPLTFRRDMRPGWLQVRGPRRWGHGVGTVVGEERNLITTGLGVVPLAPWNLETSYLDAGRMARDRLLAPW